MIAATIWLSVNFVRCIIVGFKIKDFSLIQNRRNKGTLTKTPHISVNKLAEFTVTTESRKRSILKTIKSQKVEDFTKRITYTPAKNTIKTFMVDEKHDPKLFEIKRTELQNLKPASDFKKNDIKNSLLAIKKFESCYNGLIGSYLKLKARRGLPKGTRNVLMNGVLIHLAPDVAFFKDDKQKIIGAIKLVFSKNRAITPMEGQIIAGLLYRYIKRKFKEQVDIKNCFAFDVFAKKIFTAPDNFNYHQMRLKKAYSEIGLLWPKI